MLTVLTVGIRWVVEKKGAEDAPENGFSIPCVSFGRVGYCVHDDGIRCKFGGLYS